MIDQNVLAVFAKAPVAGRVKTRLAEAIGDAAALQAHIQLVEGALNRLAPAQQANGWDTVLWLSEAHPQGEIWADTAGAALALQRGADLGARMQGAMLSHFADGYQRVLLIGCDCPPIDRAYIDSAFAALQTAPVILGPAEDGGYGLVGLQAEHQDLLPILFDGMHWGTAQVMAQTRERLTAAAVTWRETNRVWDVDEVADWQRYCAESTNSAVPD